jgi:hypothetical protein
MSGLFIKPRTYCGPVPRVFCSLVLCSLFLQEKECLPMVRLPARASMFLIILIVLALGGCTAIAQPETSATGMPPETLPTATTPPAAATAAPTVLPDSTPTAPPALVGPEWQIAYAGDLNQDGQRDLVAYKPTSIAPNAAMQSYTAELPVTMSAAVIVQAGADGTPQIQAAISAQGVYAQGTALIPAERFGDGRPSAFLMGVDPQATDVQVSFIPLNDQGGAYAQGFGLYWNAEQQSYGLFVQGQQQPLPGGDTPTPIAQLTPTEVSTAWQALALNDEGILLRFELPADWQQRGREQVWSPEPASDRRIGVRWSDVPPGGSIQGALLPNHSEPQQIEPFDLGGITAQKYHLVRYASASASGGIAGFEQHVVFELNRGGVRRAYSIFVAASTREQLDATLPVFQHALDSFTLDDSAIAPTPTGEVVPPGSTLPLDDPAAAAPDLYGPEQTVRNFYSWYLKQAGTPGNPDDDQLTPYHAGVYQESPYLTEALIRQINDRRTSPAPGDHDPLTCSIGYPKQFRPGEAQIAGDAAAVEMESSMPNHAVTVRLLRVDGVWQINEAVCQHVGV